DLSRAPCDPRDGVEPGERVGLRRGEGRDLAVAGRDGVVEELDVAQCPPVPDGRAETLPPDRRRLARPRRSNAVIIMTTSSWVSLSALSCPWRQSADWTREASQA